jgi:hypothetical protein
MAGRQIGASLRAVSDGIQGMKSRKLQIVLLAIGGSAVIACFFFGTLFALDFMDRRSRDTARIDTVKSVMAALEKYRAARGAYPVLPVPDIAITQLSGPLVGGGYLTTIPNDPPGADQTRYVSLDGTAFGLRIALERSGVCRLAVGGPGTGWWGNPPPCPF